MGDSIDWICKVRVCMIKVSRENKVDEEVEC